MKKEFDDLSLSVIHYSLGYSNLSNILSLIDHSEVCSFKHLIQHNNGQIESITIKQDITEINYEFDGLTIGNKFINAFSVLLGFIQKNVTHSNLASSNLLAVQEYRNKRIFQFFLTVGLGIILSVLTINFLVFQYYFDLVEELKSEVQITKADSDRLRLLNDKISKKEDRVNALLANNGSSISKFLDVIGENIPDKIKLDELEFQPLLKKIKEGKPVLLENNTLLISGNCIDSKRFTEWIEVLESMDWITAVATLEYDYVKKNTSHFLIKIEF